MTTDAELPDNGEDSEDLEGPPLHELAEWAVGASLDICHILDQIEDEEQDLGDVTIQITVNAMMLLETLWYFTDMIHESGLIDIEVLENIVEAKKHLTTKSQLIH